MRVVVAIAEEGSVTRGAKVLHQSSSAVSHTLLGLEAELGVDLFHRLPQGMALTDAGQAFVDAARRALHEADVARGSVDAIKGLLSGHVRVATVFWFETPLADLVGEFCRRHPDVIVSVSAPDTTDAVTGLVRSGACDVGLTSSTNVSDDLVGTQVFTDQGVIVVPAGHHLAGRSQITIADLAGERIVAPLERSMMRPLFDAVFRHGGVEPRIVVEVATNDMALELVRCRGRVRGHRGVERRAGGWRRGCRGEDRRSGPDRDAARDAVQAGSDPRGASVSRPRRRTLQPLRSRRPDLSDGPSASSRFPRDEPDGSITRPPSSTSTTGPVGIKPREGATCRSSTSHQRGPGRSTSPSWAPGPISYEDSISPEHYELERRAIFERTWLNVGRVEQLPKPGSYFTKDLDVARTSLIIARGLDGEVRAFHNMCRHRGNKLVWQDYPDQETQGVGRQFTCKYHGWRYGTDGACTFVQQESEFFDFDKADYGLVPVHLDVWEGFIFVNLDKATPQPLRDYLGAFAAGLDGYPFGAMTQVHKYRADVHANWKLYIDAFAEFYHAPVLHQKQYTDEEARKLQGYGYEGLHYDLDGPHGMQSTWGGMAPPKDPSMVKPIERVLRSGNFGAWDRPDIPGLDPLPAGINPSGHKSWGLDSFVFFPNFMIVVWAPGWYLTYHYWPTAYNRHTFEGTLYFVPPANARERMRQELAAVTFKEFGLQDCNTLEATQRMLESRAVTEFPLNDQEIMLRHLHQTAGDYVARLPAGT